MKWRHTELIDLDDWTREEFKTFLQQADYMEELLSRPIKKVPALRGKLIVNFFYEPSTRTKVSFELAEKFLSADVTNWQKSGSSASKGETMKDTAWTLEAMGADAVVIRHGAVGAADYLSRKLSRASVFNAGDGTHRHPTQALLDLHAAKKKVGDLEGANFCILGDVLHSRVARSDIKAFSRMGASVTVSGPATLMPRDMNSLDAVFEPDPHEAVKKADIIYLLRIQQERQEQGLIPSLDEYHERYGVTSKILESARKDAVVMHPGPINRRVEASSDVFDGEKSLVLKQVRSGVAVRMALLYLCLGGARS